MEEMVTQDDLESINAAYTLFKPASWLTKIDFINHLISLNNILITVLSAKEGGKTSFGLLLQNDVKPKMHLFYLTVQASSTYDHIVQKITTKLHFDYTVYKTITSIVTEINKRQFHFLLIIDNAQYLSESIIQECLFALKNQQKTVFFHLCFIADYALVPVLTNLVTVSFKDLIHTVELGNLSKSETKTYVMKRAIASELINKPLSESQLAAFYQMTQGNLAKINAGLEAFIFNCSEYKKNIQFFLKKSSGLAAVALLFLGFTYLYSENFKTSLFTQNKQPQKVAKQLLPASYGVAWKQASIYKFINDSLPKNYLLTKAKQDSFYKAKTKITNQAIIVPYINLTKILESQLVSIKNDTQLEKKQVIKPAFSYTIQLVASHKIEEVKRFRKNNNIQNQTKIRRFSTVKGNWYIVTYGEYANRGQAQRIAKKLSKQLAVLKPWVRPLAGLVDTA